MSEVMDEISMGPFGSDIKVSCFVDQGIPALNGSNLIGFRLKEDAFRYLTKEKADSLGRANAFRGDVIVTHRGTLGQIVYVPQNSKYDRYVISQSQFRFKCSSALLPEYITYYFHSPEGQYKLLSNASQVGVPALARATSTFRNIEIALPPLPTQRSIAAVLGALDDKIELNRRMNANLEEQAQALFKSWFVDFAPWGGKMPEGWKKIPLSSIAEFVPGYSYKGNELQPSDVAMATIKNYERRGGFKLDGFKEIKLSAKLKDSQSVRVFDTLVAHTDMTQNADVIGNAEILLSDGGYSGLVFSMDLVKVVPKGGLSRFLLAAMLKNPLFKAHCLGYVNGTTVLHMSKSALSDYELYFPDDACVLNDVADRFEKLYRLMAKNLNESRKLAELRDALLPKLMSGELAVGDVL